MKGKFLIDSPGWIEYFTDGPLANEYEKYLDDLSRIITPTIIVYEIYKKVKRERGEESAGIAVGQLMKTQIVPLDSNISILAADISLRHSLPMADAIVYATAQQNNCVIVTSDKHFENLSGVKYLKK